MASERSRKDGGHLGGYSTAAGTLLYRLEKPVTLDVFHNRFDHIPGADNLSDCELQDLFD